MTNINDQNFGMQSSHLLTSNKSRVVRFNSTFYLKLRKMMPQGDKDKNDEFSIQNGCKGKVKYAMALY